MKTTKQIQIPFDGFYESHAIDQLEQAADYAEDVKFNFEKFARHYVDLYTVYVENEYDTKLNLTFVELWSPPFYNFGTDRIYCEIPFEQLERLHAEFITNEDAQELINDRFKSRPGFASFYDEFCSVWRLKPLNEWDENELSILLPPVTDYWELYADAGINGGISECVELKNGKLC